MFKVFFFGIIPESIITWWELTAPAKTITSLLAIISWFLLSRTNHTWLSFLHYKYLKEGFFSYHEDVFK